MALILSRPVLSLALPLLVLCGCVSPRETLQTGGRILVAGRPVATEARVITWKDPGGYDAYQAAMFDETSQPRNYAARKDKKERPLSRGDFKSLKTVVDQIVIHYDGSGLSRLCFDRLRERQLSAHFLIDLDGTIYQTLDLEERAYHATTANSRSIGIEIANVGAFPPGADEELKLWYQTEGIDGVRIVPPPYLGNTGILSEGFVGKPSRAERVHGNVQRIDLVQYDFTPEQYEALVKLIDALCRTFPRIERKLPRDADGKVVMEKLPDDQLAEFRGVLGHFHIQENKVDPGPAFQWERLFP